jgi:uncharacterized phosphosugar-binding protein
VEKVQQYFSTLKSLVDRALETQMQNIHEAGTIVANTVMKNGYVYAFGTGHSHMMAEELFYRAGGLARVYPIFEEALMLHNGAIKSTEMERLDGYAELILDRYECSVDDCLIIASNSGRNPVIIEMAQGAHDRGMKVIALTNLNHSRAQDSRHKSGLKLFQIADVVLDNQGCVGDASIFINEIGRNTGATSTSIGALLLHAVEVAAIEIMVEKNFDPEIFSSCNLDEGDEINESIFRKFKQFVKPL